ncbi:TPA_exp: Uncharacterized protein A8136_1312 [Trichophyton benhamiae CBS 112371]|nr:TPA_exp: Uncharacterized protein A8136_1312 [Trichophyton benhamiae CBS 112371]
MSSSLKRPSNDDNQEDTWANNQAQNEGANTQGNSQQQDPETTEDPGEDTTQNTTVEQVSTTEATAPARRPKKPRRGKNSPEPNYSELVQGQMSSTNRTGQACDRCKGRKMKCDSNSTGCANCVAGNLPCTQTDPITRVSYTRGELERLRAENGRLATENELLRTENANLRDYISNVVSHLGSGGAQAPGMSMETPHPYPSYDALQSQAQAQAIHQTAQQQPGQSFPILYPPGRRPTAMLPSMQDPSQFGVVIPPSQYPTYNTSMASNPFSGRDNPVPSQVQQSSQSSYRQGIQQQQQQQQQGARQGHSQSQVRGQGESHQQTGALKRDHDPSQDPPDNYNYFSGM